MSNRKQHSDVFTSEFALGHWGTHSVLRGSSGKPELHTWAGDADPNPIGLDQLSDNVQALRVRRPSFRRGWLENAPGISGSGRGQDSFIEVPWDEASELVARELERVIERHGNRAIFGGSYGWGSAGRFHHAQSQIHRFLNAIGGYVRGRDSYSYGAGSVIMPHVVAPMEQLLDQHTDWNTLADNNELFVAFGGVPLRNTRMTAGGPSSHRVRDALDKMRRNGTRFVTISPLKQDMDGLAEWIPIRPNTDVAFMLALIHVLLTEGLHSGEFLSSHCVGTDRVRQYVLGESDGVPKTPAWASAITHVVPEVIASLARSMAGSRTMINASWSLQRQSHGEQSYWALVTLAAHLGQIGQPGGGFGIGYGTLNSVGSDELRISGPRLSQGRNAVSDFIPVARIADALLHPGNEYHYDGRKYNYPDLRLIYWAGGNPYHHHQDLNRFMSAWQRPETIIVHEQYWTSTAKAADIVLPASLSAERNDIGFASREGQLLAMRRLVEPNGDARSDYDIFCAIAEKMGRLQEFSEGRTSEGWLEFMYRDFKDRVRTQIDLPDFPAFWKLGRIAFPTGGSNVLLSAFRNDPKANPLATPSGRIELYSAKIAAFHYDDCPGQATWIEPVEWLGSRNASRFPLHLLSQEPRRRLHSQLDHSAHSRAGKIKDREPILISRADAVERGIAEGDVVRVFNDRGAFLAAAKIEDDLLHRVAVIATGAWFDPQTWDKSNPLEKHGNPNAVTLDAGSSKLSQATVAQSCLVEIERFEGPLPEVTAFALPTFTKSRGPLLQPNGEHKRISE